MTSLSQFYRQRSLPRARVDRTVIVRRVERLSARSDSPYDSNSQCAPKQTANSYVGFMQEVIKASWRTAHRYRFALHFSFFRTFAMPIDQGIHRRPKVGSRCASNFAEERPQKAQNDNRDDDSRDCLKHPQGRPFRSYDMPGVHDDKDVHRDNKRKAEDNISPPGRARASQ